MKSVFFFFIFYVEDLKQITSPASWETFIKDHLLSLQLWIQR